MTNLAEISYIYYFNFIFLSLLALYNKRPKKSYKYAVFLYLSVLIAIRYNVGTDYVNYVRIFDETSFSTLFEDETIEYGAYGSMALFKSLGLGVPWWFFFISMMSMITFFLGIDRFGFTNFWWGLLIYYSIYFFNNQCNLMQHGAMAGWTWLAFSYINERHLKKFMIFSIIGASFHILGIFFIPFYWILKRDLKLKFILIIIGFAFVFNFFLRDSFLSIFNYGYIGNKIQYYQDVFFVNQELNQSISIGMIIYTILLISLYSQLFEMKNDNFVILRNTLLFSIFFQIGFKGTGIFDARIGGLLNMSMVILIPLFFCVLANNYGKYLKLIIILYSFLMFVTNVTSKSSFYKGGYQFLPYKTIFQKNN